MEVRPEIKQRLDELAAYALASVTHLTDSESGGDRKEPAPPKPFDAGKFKTTFSKGAETRAIVLQTEEKVGHVAPITPGKTDVGGYVQLLDDPSGKEETGPKLNREELDYFVQSLYDRFARSLTDDEAQRINQVKDYALAILFSGRTGILKYHNRQIERLRHIHAAQG